MLHIFHPSGQVGKWQFHILISATYSYFGANIFHIFHPLGKRKNGTFKFPSLSFWQQTSKFSPNLMKEKSPVKMQNVVRSFPHSWSCVVDCLCRAVNQVDDDHDHGDEDDHHADDDGDKNKTGHLYISTERS